MNEDKDSDLIERIGSVQRYRPRTLFRIKVTIASAFPSYGVALAGKGSPRLGWGPRAGFTRPVKWTAAAAMALLVAILIFSGLVAASSGSLPGQALYGLKRFRERVDLALTSSPVDKAQRYLSLASARLAELDALNQKGVIDSDSARGIARDYAAETSGATRAMQQQAASAEAQSLARQLQALQTQKDNMVRRMAAVSPAGVLAEAEGARVSVSGAGVTAGQSSQTADSSGKVSFAADVTPGQAAGLQATVEEDGRKAVVPLYQPTSGRSGYTVVAQPGTRVLELNQPVLFTLKIARANGTAVGPTLVRLSDSTLTSTVDGKTGAVVAATDRSGTCQVTITKTSLSSVSQITLQVEDPGWVDAGVALTLGGVEVPPGNSGPGDVKVTSSGAGANLQQVVLDNGLVKVTAERGIDGEIISSVTRPSSAIAGGPLTDPLPAQAALLSRVVTISGPRLLFTDGKAAGYETILEMPEGDGSVKKDYKVFLASGDKFATVQSSVTVTGSAAGLAGANPALLSTCQLPVPAGAVVGVGGNDVARQQGPSAAMLNFQVGNPYFTITQGQDVEVGALPIDSATYPQSLTLTADTISPTAPTYTPAGNSAVSQTMMLGMVDKGSVEDLVSRARLGVGDPMQVASAGAEQGGEGFTVVAEPSLEKLSAGKQKITLKVYKQYDKVISSFLPQ